MEEETITMQEADITSDTSAARTELRIRDCTLEIRVINTRMSPSKLSENYS